MNIKNTPQSLLIVLFLAILSILLSTSCKCDCDQLKIGANPDKDSYTVGEEVDFSTTDCRKAYWFLNDNLIGSKTKNLTYTFNEEGVYFLETSSSIKNDDGCYNSYTIAVYSSDSDCRIVYSPNRDIHQGDEVTFRINGNDVEWYIDDKRMASGNQFKYNFVDNGLYKVRAVVSGGITCEDEVSVEVSDGEPGGADDSNGNYPPNFVDINNCTFGQLNIDFDPTESPLTYQTPIILTAGGKEVAWYINNVRKSVHTRYRPNFTSSGTYTIQAVYEDNGQYYCGDITLNIEAPQSEFTSNLNNLNTDSGNQSINYFPNNGDYTTETEFKFEVDGDDVAWYVDGSLLSKENNFRTRFLTEGNKEVSSVVHRDGRYYRKDLRLNIGKQILDSDNDGIPDDEDNCPTRKGDVSNNGCPTITLDFPNEAYVTENTSINVNHDERKNTDNYAWSGNNVSFSDVNSMNPSVSSQFVGKHRVRVKITGDNGQYQDAETSIITFKAKPALIREYLNYMLEFNNYSVGNMQSSKMRANNSLAENFFNESLLSKDISIIKTSSSTGSEKHHFNDFTRKMSGGKKASGVPTPSKKIIDVKNIKYDLATGKISSFEYVY